MSELQLYTQQQEPPVDAIAQISRLAQQGPRAVMAYSLAFDRLPDADKQAHIARLHDARDKENLEFINYFRTKPVVKTVLVRNPDGTPFLNPQTGALVYEDQVVEDVTDQIVARLAAPII